MLRTLALLTALGAAAAAAPDRCPAGYSVFADQGACYKYIATSKTWDQAKAHCALETAYLAEYSVQVDLDFIWSQCLSQTCWLGGTDRAQEGTWRWDHSNGLVPADWGPGEPNNCCGGEDCLQISPNQPPDPGLNDLGCTAGRQFVCERPTGCPPGQYRANANTCTNCAAGRYQPSISVTGVADCLACAAGKYANNVGRSTACTASCTQRYYCPEGSTSATPFECPAGKYGGSAGLGTASCSGNVAPGHYSLSRAASSAPTGDRGNRCPAGRFGAGGASSTACSGPCQAGYFCPIGAGSATHTACGGANKYCPQGSATASNVPAGSYSTPTSPGTVNTRSGIVTCEAGHYCSGGLRTPCAAGRYHSGTGRSSACTAQCAAGFFCPAGSSVATAEPCRGANRFCIAGSSGPATVSSGHYSTPESNPPDQRTGQAPCAEDEFCSGGVRTKRITFTNMCTSPVAGTNAFADTWTVNENAPGATVTGSSLTYTKLGSNTLTPTLVEVPGSYDAGCPQSTAAMNAMFELSNSVTPGGVGTATVSLKSGAAFNFETCSAYAVRVHLTLTGSSTNPLFSCTVNVAVGDVNDRPTYVFDTRMTGGRFLRELAEDTRVRAVVPAFAANPAADSKINTADEDTAQEVRYEIVDVGNPAHDDFAIGTCSGQLFVNQALSFERTPVYTLTVRVTDNGVPPLSADIDVVVNVLDVNEAPVFENTPYTLRLEENEPVGYVITGTSAIVSASDEDTPAGLTYSMQVLDTDPANPPFELRSDGTIATRAVLDFEAVPDFDLDGERDYRVNLLVTDSPIVPGGITFQVTHPTVITLVDTNDPPMLLDLGTNGNQVFTDHFTPYENIPDLTVVGVIQAADPDGDSIDTMVVQDVGAAAIFRAEMVTATEWNLVKYAGTLDFEATPSYSFTLRMTDDDSVDPRSTDVTITVDVQNVNEVSAVTPGQGRTFAEDATSSDIAAQLLATDPDAGDVLTWAIENAPTAWGVKQDGGLFPNQNSGMLDFETTPAYTVRVRTTDRGVPVPQLTSAWEDVTISITNVNEPPVVTPGQVFEIDENSPSGFAVGTVAFADPDTTDSHDFYHLWGPDLWNVRDSAQPIFTLASNGDLTVAAGLDTYPWHSPLDFEERASEGTDSFTLWVALRDAGVDGPRMFSNETITVRLRDVNEVPLVTQPQARTVREQEPIGTQLGGPVEILDQENSTITCTVQSGAAGSQAYITYDVSATCVVTLATAAPDIADNTVQWELLSVTGEDSMGQQHSGMLNITIAASNAVPTFVPGAPTEGPLTIPEGSTNVIASVDTNTDDTDVAQTLTYQLVASSPAFTSGWFTVDLATGDLAGTPQVDYEALAGETVPYRVQVSVQVQDDGPGQLTAVQTWDIMVTNVNEAPWLNGTAVHTVFSLPETDFPGTVLNAVVGGVAATDPDGDMLTFSLTQDASLFAVSTSSSAGAATGVIAMDNTVVSHEDKGATQPHLLTLTVTDNGSPPLSHSLPITIQVTDVNEPPVLMPTEVFVVNEDTLGPGESPASGRRVDFKVPGSRPPGGKVSSTDPDTNDLAVLGSAYYAIVGGVNAAHFTIDNTGVIRVTDGQELDFETYDVYNLDVRVCDTSATVPSPGQLCDTVTYTIEVVDVPDISITSFYLFDSATGRVVPNDPANGVPTDGGDIYVVFNGTDMVRAADVTPAYPVTATLSYEAIPDTALPDTATSDCRMLTQDSVWCKHPEGAGKATWLVTVGTTPADMQIQEDLAGLVVTQHSQPTLTSVVVDGNGDGLPDSPPTLRMGTEGGATLLVTGTNFGPAGNVLASSTILYGPASSFLMQSCVMVTPHTAMRCVASAGYSTQLAFTVRIGGVAGASLPTNVGYLDPNITSVTLAGGGSAPTSGGTRFTVRGHNFGPPGLGLLVGLGDPVADATLDSDNCGASPQDSSLVDYRYAGMACSRDSNSPHRVITCDMPEGSGTDHSVFVRVFLEGSSSPNSIQTSQRSVQALSYMGPTLTSIGGNGVQRADTEGNERMLVRGDNLGRVAPCQGVASAANNLACTGIDDATRGGVNAWAQPHLEYARTADLVALNWTIPDPAPAGLWRSASGCVVTALGVMSCCSAEGTGFDFTFRLTVDGQTTAQEDYLHLPEASYHVPVVRGYEDATPAAPVGDDDAVVVAPTGVLAEPQSPTVGGQAVRVLGNFFGPSMSTVDNVKYGALVEKEFNVNVADCVMETPHRSLICLTVPGAGADLAWTLTVDGQQSQVPTTDYGIPHISHFDTPTTGASTLGMEPVTIRGMNFGPVATLNVSSRARELADFPVFLDWVRYGPVTGEEYNARDCVVVGHTEVSCVTAPGSGDNLKWTMSVSGQRSEIPDMLWSYAQPVLNGMEVLTSDGGDPTTAGGVRVRLTGLDFASADVETKLRVRITVPYYQHVRTPEFRAYMEQIGYIEVGAPFTVPSEMPEFIELDVTGYTFPTVALPLQEAVDFTLPAGVGENIQVQLVQVPRGLGDESATFSNAMSFDYKEPGAPAGSATPGFRYRTQDLDAVRTLITIRGSSLGRSFGTLFDGFVFVDAEVVTPDRVRVWNHGEISVVHTKLAIAERNASAEAAQAAGTGGSEFVSDAHFHVHIDIFKAIEIAPITETVTTCNPADDYFVDVYNATCNCTVQVLTASCTSVEVPTGNFSAPAATWHTEQEEVQATSPSFSGRVGDTSPAPTQGGVDLQFKAKNIGSDINLMTVYVGENAVMKGAMDGAEPRHAVGRTNLCNVTNIAYDDVAREGTVTCTLPAGQGTANRLAFEWNNKEPNINNASSVEDFVEVAYQTPTVTGVEGTVAAGASAPLQRAFTSYETSIGNPESVLHFTFPTEGGELQLSGMNLGLTGGLAFKEHQQAAGVHAAPQHQFNGLVQDLALGSLSYALATGHSHWGHNVSIPASLNTQPAGMRHLMQYRHCGAVGCPIFDSAVVCGDLATTTLSYGEVCDTTDTVQPAISTNPTFSTIAGRESPTTLSAIDATQMLPVLTMTPPIGAPTTDPPVFVSYSYQGPTLDAAATTALSRTAGGDVLRVVGTNFGPAAARPLSAVSVMVGSLPCPLIRDGADDRVVDSPAVEHRQIQCTMPVGAGLKLPVTVTVGSMTASISAAASLVSYQPPVVTRLSHNSGPTDASNGAGGQLRIFVYGDNFGNNPAQLSLVLRSNPTAVALGRELDLNIDPATVMLYNHTTLSFLLPQGQGDVKILEVVVAGQSTRDSMNVPSGAGWPDDSAPLASFAAQPWGPLLFRFDDPVVTAVEGAVGTRGGVLTLLGANFGVRDCNAERVLGQTLTVAVDLNQVALGLTGACVPDEFCSSHTHTRMQCRVTAGVGAEYDLTLRLGSRLTVLPREFSYLPPRLEDVSPTPARADVGFELTLTGQNFGTAAQSNATVFLGEVECTDARIVQTDTTTLDVIKCNSQIQTVGPKDVNLTVAYQTFAAPASEGWVELNCPEGLYGQVGELCQACPDGGACFNHRDPTESCLERIPNVGCNLYREPISVQGTWKLNTTTAEELCQRDVRVGNFTEACPVMVGCDPPEACAGNNRCGTGYTGDRCGRCALRYYRLDGECVRCPDLGWLFILLFVVGILAVCGLGLLMNRYKVNLAFISIGVDYFQVLGLFARSKVAWPRIIKQVLSMLSIFNLNLDLAAPECASPDLEYHTKWIAIMMLPLIIFSVFFMAYLAKYIFKRWFKNVPAETRNSHLPALVSTSVLMFYLLYLYLTRTTFDMFNCSPTDPDDGFLYLEVVFEKCWESATHQLLFPLACVTLVVYVLAYPAGIYYVLSKNRDTVKIDQILRAKGLGDDKYSSSDRVYAFRKMWNKVYYQFKPGKWYWQPIIVARKFMIAVTSLFFRGTPSFQMALIVLLLFFAYAAQVKQRPYMSTSERRAEVLYHEQKVLEGDPRHMKLNETVKAVDRRMKTRGKKANMDAIKKASERTEGVNAVLDYNTLETVLLTCAILVAMAAVLFESRRLRNGSSPIVREALVWVTLLIIFGSMVYFMTVFVIEVMETVAPEFFAKCCKCCKAKKSTIELEVERGMAGMKASMPTDTSTAINPLLAGTPASAKSLSPEEVEQILELLATGATPTHPQWQAIRTFVLQQRGKVTDTTNEIRGLKKAVTVASAKASLSSKSEDRKKRRPKGKGKSKRNFAQAATRRSTTTSKKAPGISKTSASRIKGQK